MNGNLTKEQIKRKNNKIKRRYRYFLRTGFYSRNCGLTKEQRKGEVVEFT